MQTVNATIRDLFFLAVLLVVVAYAAGTSNVLGTLFKGANTLQKTAVGENAQGTAFLNYPSGGPGASF